MEAALETIVRQDKKMGLMTVVCPKCGITAGVLPTSDTWHAPCGGVVMHPADPVLAKRMRQASRSAREKVKPQISPLQREKIRAQTRERVRRHRDPART